MHGNAISLKSSTKLYQITVVLMAALMLFGCQSVERTLSMTDAENSYRQGDHQRAFRLSEALAFEGYREAQYALGYMYFHGVGVAKDQRMGVFWIEKSANQGYKTAEAALNSIQNFQSLAPLHLPQAEG